MPNNYIWGALEPLSIVHYGLEKAVHLLFFAERPWLCNCVDCFYGYLHALEHKSENVATGNQLLYVPTEPLG